MHPNKSNSPTLLMNSNSGRQNSTSRSSEISNPMRRSFGANPFMKPSVVTNSRGLNPITPVNSPSDYRASLTRESLTSLKDCEDKENGKDQNLKQTRLRSPTVVKGTKNFMSPTISACSKINASPRKKILTERNEPIRTSGNNFPETLDMNSKPECEAVQAKIRTLGNNILETLHVNSKPECEALQEKIEASSDSTVTCVKNSSEPVHEATSASKGSKKKVAFDTKVETIPLMESECVDVDEDMKAVASPGVKSPGTASTLLAPLDADPLMPPYDPKTNYLSPRPQFLHYKPSLRIKCYLDEEGDGNPLEESFNLDSFSDTDFTDETQSDSSQKESSDDVSSDKLAKDVEANKEILVTEVVPSVAETVNEMVEPRNSSKQRSLVAEVEKEMVEPRNASKQRFFTRTKCFALILLMVLLAGLWMPGSNSALGNIPAINDPTSFTKLLEEYKILEVVKENFKGLAQNLRHWYGSSYSHISELVHKLRGGTTFGSLLYYNLTDMHEGLWLDNSIEDVLSKSSVIMPDYKEKTDEEPLKLDSYEAGFEVMEEEVAEEGFEEDGQVGTSEDVLDEVNSPENDAEEGDKIAVESEILQVAEPKLQPVQEPTHEEVASVPMETEGRLTMVETPEVADTHNEIASVPTETEGSLTMVETPEDVGTHEEVASVPTEMEGCFTMAETPEVADDVGMVSPIETKIGYVPLRIVVSSVVVALVASALLYMKKGRSSTKPSPASPAVVVKQPNLAKKFNIGPQHDAVSYPTEVDVVGESCPSEMSSFQNTSAWGEEVNENEAQSYERKQTRKTGYRRESMASSDLSLGSASYGSFTTYEMISAKHRNGEEEVVVTPIRRSSRLRK